MYTPNKRKKKWLFLVPFFVAAYLGLAALAVMLLWNAILPSLLAVGRLGFWQALGLLLLCRILFGGLRGRGWGGHGPGWRPWKQKWMTMTEEERVRFRQEWKSRCGSRFTGQTRPAPAGGTDQPGEGDRPVE